MDQNTIVRYARLILSMPKLSEVDENAKAVCEDIIGKARSNDKPGAIKKISDVMAQCNIKSTDEENQKIYDQIHTLI